jgi:hypothetical protein
MKYLFLILSLLIGFQFFSQTKKEKIEQNIINLHKKKFDWLISKQHDSLAALFNDNIEYIHSNGWIENKTDIIADLKSGKLNYKRVEVSEAKVNLSKNVAILTGKGVFFVTMDNKDLEIKLLYSEVYIKEKGKWLLSHRHSNKLP